jgi:lipoprotein-releasing system permease protein
VIALALRYLLARRRQTILTLLGIFFGAAGYVVISGFFLGFQDYLTEQLVNNAAHVHIQERDEYLTERSLDAPFYGAEAAHVFWDAPPVGRKDNARVENPEGWYARLKEDPRVVAFSPQLTASALFTKARTSVSVSLIGCDPDKQSKGMNILSDMVEGNFSDIASGGNRVVVGKELLNRLGLRVSQNVTVTAGTGTPTPFKIVGVFTTGNKTTDLLAYGALSDVQRLNGTPNVVNEIGVRLKDFNQATEVATLWSKLLPEKTESWAQQNAPVFTIFRMQDIMRLLIIAIVMIVAGFGIYNVLMMTVSQKRRDVAILRSMGYSRWEVESLFLFQGLLLGAVGAALGLVCGYGVCRYLQTLTFSGPPGSTKSEHMHIALTLAIYAQSAGLALAASGIASYLPAREAGRLTPIEIIRAGD